MDRRAKTVLSVLTLLAALAVTATSRGSETPPPAAADSTHAAPTPLPKLVVPEAVADLPPVAKGEKLIHDFVIKNDGDAPLELTEVRPACGCTIASFDKVIPAKGQGKVHAELDTSNISNGVAKYITVFTNDPANPRVDLTMLAKVEDYLTFNPGFARYTRGKGYEPGVVKQLFYAPDFDSLTIGEIESPYPFLKVDVRDATTEERRPEGKGKQYVVTTTLSYEDAPVGPISGTVLVHTNHPKQAIGRLPVSGFVRPRMAITPPIGDFGDIDLTQQPVARFLVHNFTPDAVHVTSVEQTLTGASVTFSESEPGKKYFVELKLSTELAKGPFASEIKVHTDNKKEPLLIIPIKGKVL